MDFLVACLVPTEFVRAPLRLQIVHTDLFGASHRYALVPYCGIPSFFWRSTACPSLGDLGICPRWGQPTNFNRTECRPECWDSYLFRVILLSVDTARDLVL